MLVETVPLHRPCSEENQDKALLVVLWVPAYNLKPFPSYS